MGAEQSSGSSEKSVWESMINMLQYVWCIECVRRAPFIEGGHVRNFVSTNVRLSSRMKRRWVLQRSVGARCGALKLEVGN